MNIRQLIAGLFVFVLATAFDFALAEPRTAPAPGLRESSHDVHALVDAKIVVSPDVTIEKGTLVVRDGVIEAAGEKVETPADARVWNMNGKTLYPGLIDAMGELSSDDSRSGVKDGAGAGYWNANVVPQVSAARLYAADSSTNKKFRGQGVAVRLVAPSAGIIKGTSALVSTADGSGQEVILREPVALHLKLTSRGSRGYPRSPMGALTLVRQAFYDAGWYGQAWEIFARHPELERPERSDALAVLGKFLGRTPPVVVDAGDELYFLRADRLGDEFELNVIVRGSGSEYRRLEEVKATGRPIIVPLNFPKPPNVATPEAAMNVPLERLMHWDLAPENPGRLAAAGIKIALASQGLSDPGKFLSAVRKAVKRGLDEKSALTALTVTPAELYGASDRLGTLEAGKAANVVVTDGPLFDGKTKVLETWVDGARYEITSKPEVDVRGTWNVDVSKPDGSRESFTLEISGRATKLSGKASRGEKSSKLIAPELTGWQLTAAFKGEPLGHDGIVQLSATVAASDAEAADAELTALGTIVWADGKRSDLTAKRTAGPKPEEEKAGQDEDPDKEEDEKPSPAGDDDDQKDADKAKAHPDKEDEKNDNEDAKSEPDQPKHAISPVNFPLGAFGRAAPPEQPKLVLFRGATIWTCGPQGRLEKADLIVESGKINAVGANLEVPDGALVVDASGKHLSPGIIDCHSHIATDGGVNESGQTITAEVRIGDFIDPNDINIYRQLAGGVTASNILHGSANTIGGQNQVLKFRWGAGPEEMKFAAAPPGIKFALGENVKQSNWGAGNTGRYPQSRMGVEQLVRDAFNAARRYRQERDRWNRTKVGIPPRIDLELEALAEVVEGKRLIHCHSYRGDEILALIRTCDDFGVKIATFQHVLEGYKVADAIARHGAGGSSFSDWWAYKFEVYDAIPYNGALLHNAGVVVSFNSDNAELARRLNLEAAKAIKYGSVSPEEALKFVTLNPARQLHVDDHVGSLEPGKDADLVVWSGSPLSTFSRCEQTWVDGRRYFDLEEDQRLRQEAAELKAKLVQRVLASGEPAAKPGEDDHDHWPREDLFCGHHDHGDHFLLQQQRSGHEHHEQ